MPRRRWRAPGQEGRGSRSRAVTRTAFARNRALVGSEPPVQLSPASSGGSMPEPVAPPPPTDAQLDTYIKTRYALLGIDISVLPVNAPDAVMDQQRLLSNARSILRTEVAIADGEIDSQFHP